MIDRDHSSLGVSHPCMWVPHPCGSLSLWVNDHSSLGVIHSCGVSLISGGSFNPGVIRPKELFIPGVTHRPWGHSSSFGSLIILRVRNHSSLRSLIHPWAYPFILGVTHSSWGSLIHPWGYSFILGITHSSSWDHSFILGITHSSLGSLIHPWGHPFVTILPFRPT